MSTWGLMKVAVAVRGRQLASSKHFSTVSGSFLRSYISIRTLTTHTTTPHLAKSGVKESTTMADFSTRTEVLSLTSLTALLPKWSALDDPLVHYRNHSCELPREAVQKLERAANSLSAHEPHLVAFPTETVYGLGADATRSECVRRIYWAKNRPADNPLIVHIASLEQLLNLTGQPLPSIYEPLIKNFWPGPLTILLPLPDPSPFAPEVTHNLQTFGVRMPATPLARLLIALSGRPVAAPSANTSKRPSTTTAQHVLEDLNGRVDIILDGGPCGIGVESTVVDGLCNPHAILRPGGVGIEDIRALGGEWEKTVIGYNDVKKHGEANGIGPRAPGMKYKHYSPKGVVHLFDAGTKEHDVRCKLAQLLQAENPGASPSFGLIRTSRSWGKWLACDSARTNSVNGNAGRLRPSAIFPAAEGAYCNLEKSTCHVYDMELGPNVEDVARDIFAALRACDELSCDLILIEGLPDGTGAAANGLATAVMNRLRKATNG